MNATRPNGVRNRREIAQVAKIIASGLAQQKSKEEIIGELVRKGLSEESAREWVSRAIR